MWQDIKNIFSNEYSIIEFLKTIKGLKFCKIRHEAEKFKLANNFTPTKTTHFKNSL